MSKLQAPAHQNYDVVIVGGAIMGSSAAWFLSNDADFDGRILVIERDPTYQSASTMHTNSCIRQQFSTSLNVKVSQFGADFIKNLRDYMGGDDSAPNLAIQSFGYLYLANNQGFAETLRQNQKIQHAAGAATQLLSPDAIAEAYPFYNLEDIVLGSINTVDEGYWDGTAVFDCLRRGAKNNGVEYLQNEVVAISKNTAGTQVETVTLASGEVVACGKLLNASGPRAVRTSRMAGIEIPVEPRKRFTWIFAAEKPLDRELPLTIDPSGVHFREVGGGTYMAGGHADIDPAVDYEDFNMDFSIWENHIWPTIATRVPQFEAIKVQSEWVGHYAYNTFDQNAILGPHDEVSNFYFINGFSGHGLQQSPAMGRGTAEIMVHGSYQTLDLSEFHFNRIGQNRPVSEKAVI